MELKFDRDIKKDTLIRRFELEKECEEAPSTYQFWSDEAAAAERERDNCYVELKRMKADKALYYRKFPIEGVKPTDGGVACMVDADKDVVKKARELNELNHKLNHLNGNLKSLDKKTTHLSNLRHLNISGYYSKPHDGRSASDKKQDEAQEQLNKKKEQE